MSTTTTTIKEIQKGKVFIFNEEALPIYRYSNFYVSNGRVVPDEVNFFKALTSNESVAIHESEKDYLCVDAINEMGAKVLVIKNEYPYIRVEHRGKYKYFMNEVSAENSNFKFSFRLNKFHDANCSQFYGDEKLLNYHTQQQKIDRSRLAKFHSESDEWLVGVEVEKVDGDLQDKGEAWEILTRTGWSKERDGSLNSGGYEMVSPILPLFNLERIEEAVAPVLEYINANSDDSCGGHINISRKGMSNYDLLESMKQYAPILYALYPKRLNKHYCKAKSWSKYTSQPEKYASFFLKPNDVVEIRLFSRVTNLTNLKWRLDLLKLFILDGGNFNQFAQKIGCTESTLYKHFAKMYSHEKIGEKLRLMDEYSKQYNTHRNGISPSVKKRINTTMGYDVFSL
jgi:hypothetical protein